MIFFIIYIIGLFIYSLWALKSGWFMTKYDPNWVWFMCTVLWPIDGVICLVFCGYDMYTQYLFEKNILKGKR